MCNRDLDKTWARKDEFPAYREALEQLNGFAYDPRMDEAENSDEGRVSRGAAVLAGIFGCIGSAAVVIWLGALAWKAWISKIVDAIAFFLLLAVWLAAYAVLNPAEAATSASDSLPAFYLWFIVGLAGFCSACVVAVAVLDRMEARK